MEDGRLVVRDEEGKIIVDTLLAPSGKGRLQLLPEAGSVLHAEVWLQHQQLSRKALPQVLPVAFNWYLGDTTLDVHCSAEDTLQDFNLLIQGPAGFSLREEAIQEKELSLSYASWPSGKYIITFFSGDEPLRQEDFSLGEKKPGLSVPADTLRPDRQYRLQAMLEGVPEPQQASWQLRVQSARQTPGLLVPEAGPLKQLSEMGQKKIRTAPYIFSRVEQPASLDPGRLYGYVKDAAGNVVSGAFVSLSGNHLERPFYAISNEEGEFSFNHIPLIRENSYLLVYGKDGEGLLNAALTGVEVPASFPVVEIDSASLSKAKVYARKHFLLQLLYGAKAENIQEKTFGCVALSVPKEWVSTARTRDYVEFQSLGEFIQEAVPGLRVRYEGGRSFMQVLNIVNSRVKAYFKGEPLYLLNGYPVATAESLFSIDPALIDSIQVVKKNAAASYGRIAQYGIVAVFTNQASVASLLPQEGTWLPAPVLAGELALEERYGASRPVNPAGPRLEGLIKWNDDIPIGPDGSFVFELQTSD